MRPLWPWLLAGALLASVYANFALYSEASNQRASRKAPTSSAGEEQGEGPVSSADRISGSALTTIPRHHLSPTASGEHCPTLDKLGLSKEQRRQIRKCSLTSLSERTGLALEITTASDELHALLSDDSVESADVLKLADRISELRSKQFHAWIGSILVVREVLSTEQLKHLRQLEAN